MRIFKRNALCAYVIVALFGLSSLLMADEAQRPPLTYKYGAIFKPEFFSGKNTSLLNNNVSDRVWYARHTLDWSVNVLQCDPCSDDKVVEFFCSIRNKAVWGDPGSIASTTDSTIKDGDTVLGAHKHFIPRLISWMREGWISCNIGSLFSLSLENDHFITFGAFPFQLGRGIALGDAFAVGSEILGFYTDYAVDQYAFGGKLSGQLVRDKLSYDLYVAILNNKSSSFSQTAEKIRGQEYRHRINPARGSGVINFIAAGRFIIRAFDNDVCGKFDIEPYWLFNSDPEQTIEFLGDAKSHLGTIGVAGEFVHNNFKGGFDCAFNMGNQYVKSFDRNQIIKENNGGLVSIVNSKVVNASTEADLATGAKIPFVSDETAPQIAIYAAFDNEFSEQKNGQVIKTVDTAIGFLGVPPSSVIPPIVMRNAANRFRNPNTNIYKGWMAVADASWFACQKQIQVSIAAGAASGDDNPNNQTMDGVYSGFIGLQEIYSGKRVRSAFVLGGAGKIKRPLSVPTDVQAPSKFAQIVSGFTNLVFCGTSMVWKPKMADKAFNINPNILAYWQQKATHKFDALTKKETSELASNYLGLEANLFANYYPLKNLRVYLVGSVFVPGRHYTDIRGLPLSADQNNALGQLDPDGFTSREFIPNIGDNIAYTFNLGMEFKF